MSLESFYKPTNFKGHDFFHSPEQNTVLENLQVEKISEVPVVTATWGNFLSDEDFIAAHRRERRITETEEQMIHHSGFTGGWRFPENVDVYSPEGQMRHAVLGAALAKRAIEEHGWDRADVLAFASVSSKIDTPEVIADILHEQKINIDSTLFYGFACAGGTQALCDLTRMEDLYGKRVVVVALESLSGLQFDPNDISTSWTFGNGGSAIAFEPGVDIIHIAGQTWVQKDNNMIRMPYPPIYRIPSVGLPQSSWPEWYTVVGEETYDCFRFFHGGVGINQYTEEAQPKMGMFGNRTFKFFVGWFPERIVQFFRDNPFDELNSAIIHQPAEPVLLGVEKKVSKIIGELQQQGGVPIHIPEMPWLMKGTGVNNVSAATAFFGMSQLMRNGQLRQGIPTPVVGFGIGSGMHLGLINFV